LPSADLLLPSPSSFSPHPLSFPSSATEIDQFERRIMQLEIEYAEVLDITRSKIPILRPQETLQF
jgi:hypothetical protein